MGAASDDLDAADKKRRQEAAQERQRQNEQQLQSAADRQFAAGMADVAAAKATGEDEERMLQASRDLKTKRASEGKIRY